ncbi:hypothetical protein NUW58_g4768 [Xylaria curta]|uniref:Uncharacterized protein n=1 Tax=Xylaria curta TaxID=42375 RepID=A0ACC1P7P5_9PEZI|nr:hypothetical protein NUW58_g4768 [Xylaria curta]
MLKTQEELKKQFKTFASGFDDEQLDNFIADSENIMRPPAGLLLAQAGLDASTSKPFTLLDHACGVGPIAAELQTTVNKQVLAQSKIMCADINDNLVGALKRRVGKYGWGNVETSVLDAQKSDLPDESFSHVTVNFAMHVIPDPGAALQEAMRVLQPGGVFAFTVWHKDNVGWVPDMRSSFETLPFDGPMPSQLPMAPNGKSEIIDPELIPEQLTGRGFEGVKVRTMERTVPVENAAGYLRRFGMMRDWMVKSYWSEESQEKARDTLDDHICRQIGPVFQRVNKPRQRISRLAAQPHRVPSRPPSLNPRPSKRTLEEAATSTCPSFRHNTRYRSYLSTLYFDAQRGLRLHDTVTCIFHDLYCPPSESGTPRTMPPPTTRLVLSAVAFLCLFQCAAAKSSLEEGILPSYHYGASIPVECMNRSIETGEHIQNARDEIQWIPFPVCNETGKPLEFHYGIETELNCTVPVIDDPFFHLLEFYIHSDAPLSCRLPSRPPAHVEVIGENARRARVHPARHPLNVLLHSTPKHHIHPHDSGRARQPRRTAPAR